MNLIEFSEVYEDTGFNCFPVKFQSKEPAVASWKEYQTEKYTGGFKEGQNIAIVCGKISNLIVIDLDDKSLANELFSEWESILQSTLVIETSRGFHIYTRPKDGIFPPNAKFQDARGRGIDIKSEGGYVVAPPSIHPDGGKYKVISISHVVKEIDISGLVEKIHKMGFGGGLQKAKLDNVVKGYIGEGARNDSAYVYARSLLNPQESGLDDKNALRKLEEWNQTNIPPLDTDELDRIFDSAKSIPFEERSIEFALKSFKRNYVARHVTITLHPTPLLENKEIYVSKDYLYIDVG